MGVGRWVTIAAVAAVAVSTAGYLTVTRPAAAETRGPVAPTDLFATAHRVYTFARGADRPLPTDVWYPAVGGKVAPGRLPVVLFSHGLHGLPEHFKGLAAAWAAGGLVVVAPAYPHTNTRTRAFDRADLRNQPADAQQVLRRLRRLGRSDPLAGHLDLDDIAAVGFSAGAFTTTGLLTSGHDPGIRAAVLVAGRAAAPGAFTGTPVPLLFIHGDADPVVPYAAGRTTYHQAGWPKSFVTVPGGRHGEYLKPGNRNFPMVATRLTGFLRAHLFALPPPVAHPTPGNPAAGRGA